ncbi:hypothetical protein HRbin08_00427 [bacterium HR08]|nr:hypothetical protein HRbin08_00427 [bacterium HR08]
MRSRLDLPFHREVRRDPQAEEARTRGRTKGTAAAYVGVVNAQSAEFEAEHKEAAAPGDATPDRERACRPPLTWCSRP